MSDELRFGVIGCGVVSGYGHLPAIAGLAGRCRLAAVVDADPVALNKAAAQYPQAMTFVDCSQMLRDCPIDVVVIATRTDTHFDITRDCLRAGKHVLLEKPPTQTVEQGRRLLELEAASGCLVAVNLIRRYQAGTILLKRWLDDGEIGRLRAIRIIDDWWGADHRGKHPGRGMRLLREDGSVVVGEGIHLADLARWFSGSEYGPIFCVGTAIHHQDIPDHQVMTAVMNNGVVVNIEASHAYTHSSKDGLMDRQVDLVGEQGVAKWFESAGRIVLYGHDRTLDVAADEGKQFPALYEDLIASIHAGKPSASLPTLSDGVAALEAVCGAAAASKRNS